VVDDSIGGNLMEFPWLFTELPWWENQVVLDLDSKSGIDGRCVGPGEDDDIPS
jgi:hypothetical protein